MAFLLFCIRRIVIVVMMNWLYLLLALGFSICVLSPALGATNDEIPVDLDDHSLFELNELSRKAPGVQSMTETRLHRKSRIKTSDLDLFTRVCVLSCGYIDTASASDEDDGSASDETTESFFIPVANPHQPLLSHQAEVGPKERGVGYGTIVAEARESRRGNVATIQNDLLHDPNKSGKDEKSPFR